MTVKLCGITNAADALLAAQVGADYVGLIRAPSPRAVELAEARRIVELLRGRPTIPVLLFRDAPLDTIVAELGDAGADHVQLHGGESIEFIDALAARAPHVRIIKAWEMGPADADSRLRTFAAAALALRSARPAVQGVAAIIVDAAKGAPHPGIERMRAAATDWPPEFPRLWCAGGLSPANVGDAVRGTRFSGVDVARGVEAAPGRKDPALVREFVAVARAALRDGTGESGDVR